MLRLSIHSCFGFQFIYLVKERLVVKTRRQHSLLQEHSLLISATENFDTLQNSGDSGGAKEDRTPDLLRARQALSQLSYGPRYWTPELLAILVGLGGLEPPTSPLSGVRSNRLSYRPNNRRVCRPIAPLSKHKSVRCDSVASTNLDQAICCGHLSQCCAQVKEVIQPQVPLRLPCYDFTPVIGHTVVTAPLTVRLATSGATDSHGVTGGVYKARERIHRGILIRDY